MSPILTKVNFCLILIATLISSCISDNNEVYNHLVDLDHGLKKDTSLIFDFVIEDTTKSYDIKLLLRHDLTYPHYNVYFDCELGTDSTIGYKKVRELFLFDPSTGNPEGFNTYLTGKSLGGIYDHQYLFFQNIRFTNTGTYRIKLKNYMREDHPIPLHSIGLSIHTVMK